MWKQIDWTLRTLLLLQKQEKKLPIPTSIIEPVLMIYSDCEDNVC